MDAQRRKNYFIKKKFQMNFVVHFAVLLVLEGLLIAMLFMHISRGTLTTAYTGNDVVIKGTGSYFFGDIVALVLGVGACAAVAGIFIFIYLSHRIGGALYRFEKVLCEAAKGDFQQRVTLRKSDELVDLKNSLNMFLENMDSRISYLKTESDRAIKEANDEDTDRARKTLNGTLSTIKTTLDQFKTSH